MLAHPTLLHGGSRVQPAPWVRRSPNLFFLECAQDMFPFSFSLCHGWFAELAFGLALSQNRIAYRPTPTECE
jgi:hypothetical protein